MALCNKPEEMSAYVIKLPSGCSVTQVEALPFREGGTLFWYKQINMLLIRKVRQTWLLPIFFPFSMHM